MRTASFSRERIPSWRGLAAAAVALSAWCSFAAPARAESRVFVVSHWNLANYSTDNDCGADGKINPMGSEVFPPQLKAAGHTPAEIEKIMSELNGGAASQATQEALVFRGRINGKPVNIYDHPESVPDPHLRAVIGKNAYGFNLDGREDTGTFEDPETHQKGVDNNIFKALGCISSERMYSKQIGAGRPSDNSHSSYVWGVMRASMPAWIVTVTGDDLAKDGAVTVSFDKSIDHVWLDSDGVMNDKTFRLDPNPKWHTEFRSVMKNNVITSLEPVNFLMEGDSNLFTQFDLHKTRMRLAMLPDGTIDGTVGGYLPWVNVLFYYSNYAYFKETMQGIDIPGVYYIAKRLADGEPDPKTGENTRISASFRVQGLPAFVAKDQMVVRSLRASER